MKLRDEVMATLGKSKANPKNLPVGEHEEWKVAIYDDMARLTKWAIYEFNRWLDEEYRTYGGKTMQHYYNEFSTPDFTKRLQVDFNDVLEKGIEVLGINARREEVDGYDYIFVSNGDHEIEFKLTSAGTNSSFATGNKTSTFGNKKASLVWTIKYVWEDNQISEIAMDLADTSLYNLALRILKKVSQSVWKSSGGRKDSFSTLLLLNEEIGCIIGYLGNVYKGGKWLQLSTLPLEEAFKNVRD